MTSHLAVLHRQYLDLVLSGEKTIESRLTKTRRAPFGKIATGDTIYFKQSSGPIRAVATAGKVVTLTDLNPQRVCEIRDQYNDQIGGNRAAWERRMQSKYGTLIWIENVIPTGEGPVVPPLFGAAWVCNPQERAVTSTR